MNTIRLLIAASMIGAAAASSAKVAVDVPGPEVQSNVLPVSATPSASAPHKGVSLENGPAMGGMPERAVPVRPEPSVLDRELGTASDGGYHYYEAPQR